MTKQTLKNRMAALLLIVSAFAFPQGARAADTDETVTIDNKTFYVLRNNSDWTHFLSLVQAANGNDDVNAIMDGDFTITSCCGLNGSVPYRGTFDGNGHTLNCSIDNTSKNYMAPFSAVKDCTFKNLRVTGSVKGNQYSSGLIGNSNTGSNIIIDRCWVSATITAVDTHVGGFIGHGQRATHTITNSLFDGTLVSTSSGNTYGGAFIGWESGGTTNAVSNCLENGSYTGIRHTGFCYNSADGGMAYGISNVNKDNWSYHNWGEMNGKVVGSLAAWQLVTSYPARSPATTAR